VLAETPPTKNTLAVGVKPNVDQETDLPWLILFSNDEFHKAALFQDTPYNAMRRVRCSLFNLSTFYQFLGYLRSDDDLPEIWESTDGRDAY